ncbi:MAG: hypothetical protein ACLPVO_02575 [Desulfomonilaceae bacterium]
MKKAEDENWIRGMLLDEYRQCQDTLVSLKRKAEEYPQGRLGIRKRINKKTLKVYEYPCLKYSEGKKIFNRHISWAEFPEMQKRIELRDKIIVQIKSYQDRIRYIDKILRISRNKKIPT